MAFEAGGAARSRQIGGIEIILQSERHAVQRTKRGAGRTLLIRLPCGLANLIGFKRYECRKTGVSGGSRQQRVGKFFSSRLAGAYGCGGGGYAKIVSVSKCAFPKRGFRSSHGQCSGNNGPAGIGINAEPFSHRNCYQQLATGYPL